MRTDQIKKAAADFDIPVKYALNMRIRYLQSLLSRWIAYIDEQTAEMPESDMIAIIDELRRIRKYQAFAHCKPMAGTITDDMVQRAKEYPIEQLFDFSRSTRIPCPFHNSKGPDLSWHKKSNTVHCFGSCGQTWGPINVLMSRDLYTFVDAVKHLAEA